MNDQSNLADTIGRIALAQAQVDEWLVQVLIELLRPLPESRVQLLVGKNSLDQKASLIRQLARDIGLSLATPLPSGAIPEETLRHVNKLNNDRDRAVHSYYSHVEEGRAQQFRSRRPEVGEVDIADLRALGDDLVQCIEILRELVDTLAHSTENKLESDSRWGEVVRGVHEVIVAGHLHERNLLELMSRQIEAHATVRLALQGHRRRILAPDEVPSLGEFLAEISSINWVATITSPDGETVQFGDTGWQDVTTPAREEDPAVVAAAIRRVGDSVQLSVEGGEMATAPWPQARDRLAERAFGPAADPGLKVSNWVLGLEGFSPAPKENG